MTNKIQAKLSTTAIKAMRRAAKNAIAENEKMGIPSYVLNNHRVEKLGSSKRVKRAGSRLTNR